jgi:hypothetical protein
MATNVSRSRLAVRRIFFHAAGVARYPKETERHFNTLAAVHVSILKTFDKCFDGGISADAEKFAAVNELWKSAKRFNNEYNARYGVAP